MHIYQIENIEIEPLLVMADDFDHAADIFRYTLTNGLAHLPKVNFDVTRWKIMRAHRDTPPWSWIKEGRAGMLYRVDEGGWEHVSTRMIRGLIR